MHAKISIYTVIIFSLSGVNPERKELKFNVHENFQYYDIKKKDLSTMQIHELYQYLADGGNVSGDVLHSHWVLNRQPMTLAFHACSVH